MPVNDTFVHIETTKTVVVHHGDESFPLPEGHEAKVGKKKQHVRLSSHHRHGTYSLDRIEETHEEYRLYLSSRELHADADPSEQGYPFPGADAPKS